MNQPEWKDIFNASHKRWGWIEDACNAAKVAGYKYLSWNGCVIEANSGYQICLNSEINSGKLIKPLVDGVKKEDLTHGSVNYCSWERMRPFLQQASGHAGVVGVRVTDAGLEIVVKD